jgi:hypothetical protein
LVRPRQGSVEKRARHVPADFIEVDRAVSRLTYKSGSPYQKGPTPGRKFMRIKLFMVTVLALAVLTQAHAEESKIFGDELRQSAPPPPSPPPAEVRPTKDELIAKAKIFAADEIPIWKAQLRSAAAGGAKTYEWQLPTPTGPDPYTGTHYFLDLKSMDEMRVFWGTYFDILKQNMPGVAVTIKYFDSASYEGKPHGVEMTASW